MAATVKRKRIRSRICPHCKDVFKPKRQNNWHQVYCCKTPQCRAESKQESQRRWLSSCKGEGYFKGPDNSARVRAWRAANPGYCSHSRSKSATVLQDVSTSELTENQSVNTYNVLQDLYLLQPALLVGLIANFTGSVLQDDIAETTRRLVISGRDILGNSS